MKIAITFEIRQRGNPRSFLFHLFVENTLEICDFCIYIRSLISLVTLLIVSLFQLRSLRLQSM